MLVITVNNQENIKKYFIHYRNGVFYSGKFDAKDLAYYFQKLGIQLELEEANRLVGK